MEHDRKWLLAALGVLIVPILLLLAYGSCAGVNPHTGFRS